MGKSLAVALTEDRQLTSEISFKRGTHGREAGVTSSHSW